MPPLPAVMLEFGPICASVLLSTFRMRTATPMPTKPPATAPARPRTWSLSFARTRTLSPATTVPLIAANVPSATAVAGLSAPLATVPLGARVAIVAVDEAMCPLTFELSVLSLLYWSS